MFYGYYSGAYFGRNTTANGTSTVLAGYGAVGAPTSTAQSADRYLFEPEFGWVETIWKDAKYGDLKIITQAAYVSRTPWYVPANTPSTAHTGMMYLDLRYDIP